jgi:hypothetical protein
MESLLLEAIHREEVMKKHWDYKLMFKEEEDGPEIDLLTTLIFRSKKKTIFPTICAIQTSVYTNFLIDSMALDTGRDSRRRSTHL